MMKSVEETVTILEHIGQVYKTICCITQKQRNIVPPGFCPALLGGKRFQRLCLIIKHRMAMICVQFRLKRTEYLLVT